MNTIFAWLKKTFAETGGSPSSVRLFLGMTLGAVVAIVVYALVRHWIFKDLFDCPPNLANLLSVAVGALSGAKAWQKSSEDNKPPQ